jgi:predicted nucleic acid-binding protein
MVLVDTSLWILHFRSGRPDLAEMLDRGEVVTHPFIIGELACGNLKNRSEILSLFKALPEAMTALPDEVLRFIEDHSLMGLGLGFIDIHLLASAFLTPVPLWTNDARLKSAAVRLGVGYER